MVINDKFVMIAERDSADEVSHPINEVVAVDNDELAFVVGNLGPDCIRGTFVDELDMIELCSIGFEQAAVPGGIGVDVVLDRLEASFKLSFGQLDRGDRYNWFLGHFRCLP